MKKEVVLSFGRMNPVTNGHEKLVDTIMKEALKRKADAMLFLSQTTNAKKDPLTYAQKLKFAKKAFGPIVKKSSARTIIEVAQELTGKYENLVVVVGSDRIPEFKRLLTKYNGQDFDFKSIEVISAGERDPDADDVTGMSASKMRGFAQKDDFSSFRKGVPSKLSDADAKELYTAVRKGMKIAEHFDLSKKDYLNEELQIYSKWSNKEPIEYAKYLTKHFGKPNELTENRAIWYDKDGFKRIEVLDEHILHASPLPHYDFVYCYVDLKVPHSLATKLAESSESITVDFLKNEVGARCASLTANAVTLNYVLEVVEGRINPSKQEYEKQIKSMKSMFASGKKFELDWWPDESGDADPNNPFYKENVSECSHFHEACWPGYTQKGMKKKGDRMVPNCVPEENKVEEAVLSIAQRKARAMRFRRIAKRVQRAKARQMKRFADPTRLKQRAVKAAYKFMRRRLSGGKDYATASPSEKMGIDKRLQKMLPGIKKLATRLLPVVRKREIERKKQMSQTKNESFEMFMEEGPSRYYKNLSPSTKEKRAAHFKKMGPKADDDKSAYVDAPGDKEAREKGLPQSKHTKKYKEMFGEEIDKKEMSRLDQLVRLGLADKKLLQVIKRGVSKLDSGEMLNPQERKAAFDLLQTLLDMTLSTDQLFRMTRTQLQKEDLDEDVVGNITRYLSTLTHSQAYKMALVDLQSLLKRKDSRHDKAYYAAQVAKSYPGIDARELSKMVKEDYDVDNDGISMAQIEVENLLDDAEEVLDMLSEMDEEPEQWVLSKITKATDYIGTVRDYLEFQDYDDEYDDEDDEDDFDYDDEEEIDDAFVSMLQDGLQTEEYEFFKPIAEEIEGLKKKAEKSGIPYGILKKVYDRGMAAWQGGHRPGATPQQWAFARVNSFITKGKGTWGGADKDLAAKVSTNEEFKQKFGPLEIGTDAMRIAYARMTPGQNTDLVTAKYSANTVLNVLNDIRTQRMFKLFDEEKNVVKEAIEMHIDKKIPFVENVFRVGSEKYFEFFREARAMNLQLEGFDKYLIEETDIGEIVEFEGQMVPLDCPMVEEWEEIVEEEENKFSKYVTKPVSTKPGMKKVSNPSGRTTDHIEWEVTGKLSSEKRTFAKKSDAQEYLKMIMKEEEEKDPPLNQPKRGGPKKFYVYVRKPDGGIKKVTWGDTTGLSVKMNDPEARKSFAARHQCSTQKDRTSAAYWACNTPRYAKQLGLSGGGSFYW